MEEVSPTAALVFGLIMGIVMWITGGLVIELNRRATDGRLKRSRLAGIRTKATMASEQAWVTGHQAALQSSIIAGVLAMASGVACALFGVLAIIGTIEGSTAMISITAALLAGTVLLVAFLVIGTVQANRASRSLES